MNTIIETLHTQITDECDVLVAGGGVAGISAALAAARQGARVLLLEKQFMLGGLATAGLVTIYLPLCDGTGQQVSFGIAEELLKLSIRYGYEANYPKAWLENGTQEEKIQTRYKVRYNAQLFAIAAEQLLRKEGVKILYGTAVCAVAKDNEKISAVIVENKSGRSAIKVKSVVDATGDADICVMSGEETELFRPGNILAAWYYYATNTGYFLKPLGAAEVPEEDRQEETQSLISRRFQGVTAEELSEMVQLAHDQVLVDFLSQKREDISYMPVTIASIPQIRMTRRIKGAYTIGTEDDHKDFPDSIGLISNWKKRGPIYEMPFGTLHGTSVKNLITVGRSISATDAMWDVTRVIPACAVTGEAAGLAAAMTDDFIAIDICELQSKLRENGVVLKAKNAFRAM